MNGLCNLNNAYQGIIYSKENGKDKKKKKNFYRKCKIRYANHNFSSSHEHLKHQNSLT